MLNARNEERTDMNIMEYVDLIFFEVFPVLLIEAKVRSKKVPEHTNAYLNV